MLSSKNGIGIQEDVKMTKVNSEMLIGEILKLDANMAGVLMACGMHCVGCPSSQGETLEEAAMVHGIDPELLLARLNAFMEALEK